MTSEKWTRDEEIIVFNLYCKIPFKTSSKNHPEVIRIAKLIGRSPSAVNMKIGNFGSFDENLKKQGIVGLTNASRLDGEIFREFSSDWDKLAYESEKLLAEYEKRQLVVDIDLPEGAEKEVFIKQRVNQDFFRSSVLASYGYACCLTGLSNSELLIASHIKPWSKSSDSEKTNPGNGLCLNALHDKAFDRGFITISEKYSVIVSDSIRDVYEGEAVEKYFSCYHGSSIRLPDKFLPNQEFLEYHRDSIFEGWK